MAQTTGTSRKALIVGAGIAGLSAATALKKAGWHPVVVERAARRRRGGYFIAMFGSGRIAAARMGLERIPNRTPAQAQTCTVDRAGNRKPGLGFQDLPNGPWMMLRGDVEQAAFEALPNDVSIRFATTPTAISQDGDGGVGRADGHPDPGVDDGAVRPGRRRGWDPLDGAAAGLGPT